MTKSLTESLANANGFDQRWTGFFTLKMRESPVAQSIQARASRGAIHANSNSAPRP
jgi:hypothetical protein